MGDSINFYGGSNKNLGPSYGDPIAPHIPASSISLATDPRTANQLKAVYDKIKSGAKAVEVQLVSPDVAESIPNQHLEELNRLRKITGVDLTLHGPLVEPTGVTREGWDPEYRMQAERQMWSALERAQKVKKDGNIVVTFHSSNGLPQPEEKIWTKDLSEEEKKQGGRIMTVAVINKDTGKIYPMENDKKDFLFNKKENYQEMSNDIMKRNWDTQLANVAIDARRSDDYFEMIKERYGKSLKGEEGKKEKVSVKEIMQSVKSPEEFAHQQTKEENEDVRKNLTLANAHIKDAYNKFKQMYNEAYTAAKERDMKSELKKLDEIRSQVLPGIQKYEKDPTEVEELSKSITNGLNKLNEVSAPNPFVPLKEFAIDQASKTFSNLAKKAYDKFGDKAPIISIENPPVGMGLTKAEDLKDLIKASREKFSDYLQEEEHMSEDKAKETAKKLIGATWDVGHINMARKYGYGTKELKEQSKIIAPYIKNIHLSDNFGMEHTELPMGMGNVPMKEHLEALQKGYKGKIQELKQVIETGNWYQHFQTTPFVETLRAFGSSAYEMGTGPTWNQSAYNMGGYYIGQGDVNPEIHHSIYGAGFSGLPTNLGGEIHGKSRFSGNAMD